MGKIVEKLGGALASLGAAGTAVHAMITWGEDGRLQRVGPLKVEREEGTLSAVRIGKLAIWDRRRRDARRAARAARRTK